MRDWTPFPAGCSPGKISENHNRVAGVHGCVLKKNRFCPWRSLGALMFASLLNGCANDAPGWGSWSKHPTADQVRSAVAEPDNYVYYPRYGTYYSPNRHQYVYQNGKDWVTRAKPSVSLEKLSASPSVQLNFKNDPAQYNENVVRNYPENWRPLDVVGFANK
jgi:hypothetical protein